MPNGQHLWLDWWKRQQPPPEEKAKVPTYKRLWDWWKWETEKAAARPLPTELPKDRRLSADPFKPLGMVLAAPWLKPEKAKTRDVRYQKLLETYRAGKITPEEYEKTRGELLQEVTKEPLPTAEEFKERYEKLPWYSQIAAETPGFILAAPLVAEVMPLKLYKALAPLAAKPGIKAVLPTAGQVVLAPLAGIEYGAGRVLLGLGKGIQQALKGVGASVKFLDRLVARKHLEQAAKALEKIKAGKEPTRTEADSLRKILKVQQEAGVTVKAPSISAGIVAKFPESIKGKVKSIKFVDKVEDVSFQHSTGTLFVDPKSKDLLGDIAHELAHADIGRSFTSPIMKEYEIAQRTLGNKKHISRLYEQFGDDFEKYVKGIELPESVQVIMARRYPEIRPLIAVAPSTFESTITPIKTRLVAAIKGIEPLRGVAEEQLHKARTQIAARIHKEFETKTGRAALAGARAAQKGRVPTEKIPGAIAEQFSGEEVGFLFDAVRTSKAFPTREVMTKANIMEALEKMLFLNELPTRGQLVWLERVFGEEFAKAVLSKRPVGSKAWELFLDTVNLPKAAMAAWDFSATLRQGGVLFWGHTRQTVPAIIPQIKTFFEGGLSPKRWNAMTVAQRQEITKVVNLGDDVAQKLWKSVTSKERQALGERYYGAMDEAIRTGGEAELKKRAELYLSDIRAVSPQLAELEESFMSRFARYLPLVRRSERAYTMYLNKIRADIFDHMVAMWRRSGMKVDTTDFPQVKELAAYINNATGRGSLGKLQEMGALLNAAMFSPRLQISRLALPRFLVSRSPAVRKIATQDLATFIGVNTSIVSLLALSGVADLELNPLSTDFGKIRIGKTRIEFWAGYQPYVRFFAQFITGARKTATGRYQPVNRWDLMTRFLETKRSPAAGIVQDILRGRTFLGEEIETWEDVANELLENFVPLFIQDVVETIEEEGLTGGYLALPGLIGAGVQSYDSANMVVGEVYYAMTQYQEAQKKLRELIEEKDVKKLTKLIKDSPDAQWVQDKGTVFSNTGRTLSRITRELDKLKKAREKVEKMDDIDDKLRQETIDEINRRMVKIAGEAMMELDRIKDKAGVD